MADFTTRAHLFIVPVQVDQRQLQPVVIEIGADQVDHYRRAVNHWRWQRQAGNRSQMQLKLADGGAILRPVAAVVHARRQLVDQQSLGSDEALHRHYADVVQLVHDRRQHTFRLLLLADIGLREGDAGAQNTVLMQVAGQRVEDGAAIMGAGTHQRHFAGEVNPLLDDALAVVIGR